MTHVMTVFCDLAGCKQHAANDPNDCAELPEGWGEVDFGHGHRGQFCSVKHALDWLLARTADDGSWMDLDDPRRKAALPA